jgi:hypothetical protein
MGRSKSVTTVHLGQFTRGTANAIAGELEKAGIVWWYKEPGYLSQVWEHGVRLFVDKRRLEEANAIAQRISAERERRRIARQQREQGFGGETPGSDN